MASDRSWIVGLELEVFAATAERSRLRDFARIVGITDPKYTDFDAARAAGHPDLLIPPTYFFSLELSRPDPDRILRELQIDRRQILHGEQRFSYHRLAFAGELLHMAPRIVDCYEKKGGALTFVVRETEVTASGTRVATLTNVMVVRELELA